MEGEGIVVPSPSRPILFWFLAEQSARNQRIKVFLLLFLQKKKVLSSVHLGRAAVGGGDFGAPFDQGFGAVRTVQVAFDQGGAARVGFGLFDGARQFAGGGGAEAEAVSVFGVEGGDQAGVVPVLDVVVRAVMDLDFDDVAVVVHEEDDDRQFVAHHLGDFLRGELERAVADHQDVAAVGGAEGTAQRGGDGPADAAPLHFAFDLRTAGQVHALSLIHI